MDNYNENEEIEREEEAEDTIVCRECGFEQSTENLFCENCGVAFVGKTGFGDELIEDDGTEEYVDVECSGCGEALSFEKNYWEQVDSVICPECGAELK